MCLGNCWCKQWVLIEAITACSVSIFDLDEWLRSCFPGRSYLHLVSQWADENDFHHLVLLHFDSEDYRLREADGKSLQSFLALALTASDGVTHSPLVEVTSQTLSCCLVRMRKQVSSWISNMIRDGTYTSGCQKLINHLLDETAKALVAAT